MSCHFFCSYADIFFRFFHIFFMELQVYTIFYFILHKENEVGNATKVTRMGTQGGIAGGGAGGTIGREFPRMCIQGGIAGGGAGGMIKREFEKKRVLPTVATPWGYQSTVGAHNPKWIIRGKHCGHIRPPGVG